MTKIVNSLLAIAVSSSVVLAQGWSGAPGKGLKYDGGDTFSFKMANQLQTHWVYASNENAANANGFTVRRARTSFSGHAYSKAIRYVLTVDGADSAESLKDGHVTWNFANSDGNSIGLRMGQGKTQFGLEGTGSSKGLFFVERSTTARAFSDARSRGAWLQGSHVDNSLRWAFGAMNGAATKAFGNGGEAAANTTDELSYVAAVNFDPMGDITGGKTNESLRQGDFREGDRALVGTVGAAVAIENTSNGTVDVDNMTFNVNTAWAVEGFQFMGEFFSLTNEVDGAAGSDPEATGFAVSGNYVMPTSGDSGIQWGFGARLSQVDMTEMAGGDEVTDISLVANAYYHGHACKTQFEVTQRDADLADTTDYIFSVAFQILF